MKRVSATLSAVLLIAGAAIASAGSATDSVRVKDPYARAVPPGQPNSAVFMDLANDSDTARALVGAESSAADVAELHTHILEDGMMKMRQIERIDLPAGKTVTLRPGGLHVMLIGLKKQLVPGDSVDLTLIFADGSRELVKAPVHKIQMPPMGGAAHGH
jgi:copper(I)-binding protein